LAETFIEKSFVPSCAAAGRIPVKRNPVTNKIAVKYLVIGVCLNAKNYLAF
jgi:hypothetical protein